MVSAIPQHLASRRTQQARMKPDWQPPYPSFVPGSHPRWRAWPWPIRRAVRSGSEPPAIARAALAELAATCSARRAGWADRAAYVDEAGYENRHQHCLLGRPARYERWSAGARAMWLGDRHVSGDRDSSWSRCGPRSQFETLFSNDRLEGIAHLAGTLTGGG
jgi:aldoxime dehydratase